jgi:adenosylmethionine-8-amino-7-oxononanoate aminotransferase
MWLGRWADRVGIARVLAMGAAGVTGGFVWAGLSGGIVGFALAQGLLLRPIGETVYVMPPYVIREEELVHMSQGIERALNLSLKP